MYHTTCPTKRYCELFSSVSWHCCKQALLKVINRFPDLSLEEKKPQAPPGKGGQKRLCAGTGGPKSAPKNAYFTVKNGPAVQKSSNWDKKCF